MSITRNCVLLVGFLALCGTILAHGQIIDDELENSLSPGVDSLENSKSKPQIDWVKISEAPPPKVVQIVGTTIELECEAVGSPAPVIYWVRGSSPQALVRIILCVMKLWLTYIIFV